MQITITGGEILRLYEDLTIWKWKSVRGRGGLDDCISPVDGSKRTVLLT